MPLSLEGETACVAGRVRAQKVSPESCDVGMALGKLRDSDCQHLPRCRRFEREEHSVRRARLTRPRRGNGIFLKTFRENQPLWGGIVNPTEVPGEELGSISPAAPFGSDVPAALGESRSGLLRDGVHARGAIMQVVRRKT